MRKRDKFMFLAFEPKHVHSALKGLIFDTYVASNPTWVAQDRQKL